MFYHPVANIAGTAGQDGLGDAHITVLFSDGTEIFGSIDSAAGAGESSTIEVTRYLTAGNTIQFRMDGISATTEDFFGHFSIFKLT